MASCSRFLIASQRSGFDLVSSPALTLLLPPGQATKQRILRMSREAHTQCNFDRNIRALKRDSGQIDFQAAAPGEHCGFVAEVSMPSQRRLQGEASWF